MHRANRFTNGRPKTIARPYFGDTSAVLRRCEVRQTYGCAEYESTQYEDVLSATTDTVRLRCVQNSARTWTLNCADGQWIANDGQEVDCTSSQSVIPSVGSPTGSAADTGNRGTLCC